MTEIPNLKGIKISLTRVSGEEVIPISNIKMEFTDGIHTLNHTKIQVQIIDAWHQDWNLRKIHFLIKILQLCMDDLSDGNIYQILR